MRIVRRVALAAVLFGLFACPPICDPRSVSREALAQEPTPAPPSATLAITGPKVVPPYRLVRQSVTGAPSGYTILWDHYPSPLDVSVATQKTPNVIEWVAKPGDYQVRVRAFKDQDVLEAWTMVRIGEGTPPEPKPPDPKPPEPQPPQPGGPLRVIFVKEQQQGLTREQDAIFNSTKIASYLNSKASKDSTGHPEWRRWDQNVDATNDKSQAIKDLWAASKPKMTALPQFVLASGSNATIYSLSDPATDTEQEVLDLLAKYGGP